jgi:hypothetical protein
MSHADKKVDSSSNWKLQIYKPSNKIPKHIKQKYTGLKSNIAVFIIIVGGILKRLDRRAIKKWRTWTTL